MYNRAFFMPNYMSPMAFPSMMRGMGAMRGLGMASGPMMSGAVSNAGRSLGLMRRLGSSFSAFRSFNWSGLINGASKTLGVVNQAIPLVRQVGPMMNNMRSMLRVASLFKDATDKDANRRLPTTSNRSSNYSYVNNTSRESSNVQRNHTNYSNQNIENKEGSFYQTETTNPNTDSSPIFFIPA